MRPALAAILLLLLPPPPLCAQNGCDGRGSVLRPARLEAGLPLLCPFFPEAPGYQLFTPAHREVVPRAGFQLGEAHLRAQWIVRYRCTGWWFLPLVISEVRTYGLVLDVEEEACAAGATPARGG